ncbi:phospholipid scramblase family protein [Tessaracoccus sp. MC1679]|uniref:phospholipid scramblase family protein n=1 Tax=Tessaracoccus sp. MC1679 TaxID=2760313 RepID=UPI002107C254|nr:phospholipid scramblase family protein [Tessaracoccus sp. MC1679]
MNVSSARNPAIAPSTVFQAEIGHGSRNRKVARQSRKVGAKGTGRQGSGTILTESVLVINQVPKRYEQRAEYAIFDREGRQLGIIRETGYNFLLPMVTFQTTESRKRTLEVVDNAGSVIYLLDRPAKMARPKVMLAGPNGEQIGRFSRNSIFSRRIDFEVGEELIGRLAFRDGYTFKADIENAAGERIASIKRTWAGGAAEKRTRADNYVVEILQSGSDFVMLSFVVTAAVVVDILFQQADPDKDHAKRERRTRRVYGP